MKSHNKKGGKMELKYIEDFFIKYLKTPENILTGNVEKKNDEYVSNRFIMRQNFDEFIIEISPYQSDLSEDAQRGLLLSALTTTTEGFSISNYIKPTPDLISFMKEFRIYSENKVAYIANPKNKFSFPFKKYFNFVTNTFEKETAGNIINVGIKEYTPSIILLTMVYPELKGMIKRKKINNSNINKLFGSVKNFIIAIEKCQNPSSKQTMEDIREQIESNKEVFKSKFFTAYYGFFSALSLSGDKDVSPEKLIKEFSEEISKINKNLIEQSKAKEWRDTGFNFLGYEHYQKAWVACGKEYKSNQLFKYFEDYYVTGLEVIEKRELEKILPEKGRSLSNIVQFITMRNMGVSPFQKSWAKELYLDNKTVELLGETKKKILLDLAGDFNDQSDEFELKELLKVGRWDSIGFPALITSIPVKEVMWIEMTLNQVFSEKTLNVEKILDGKKISVPKFSNLTLNDKSISLMATYLYYANDDMTIDESIRDIIILNNAI